MSKTMNKVDAVIVGFGWAGSIMAKELTEAGLSVVALERGPSRDTYPDGAYPQVVDELTYNIRKKLFQDLSKSTVTIRHNMTQTAMPYRQLNAFLPGTGTGGAGLHWSGVHFRVDPIELNMRSHYEERYGKKFIPEGMTIQDFGVNYNELEPFFDKAEKVFGTSGSPWTIKGQQQPGAQGKGNPFAPDRSDKFPLPAQKRTYSAQLFAQAAESVGYHPYDLPSANTSGPYTNTYGAQMGPCNFCGYCSGYACYMYSKASPNVNILPSLRQESKFELRNNAYVLRVNLTDDKKRATGVTYVDALGQQVEQPADLVILSAFQFHNVHLMLLSGIGKPYDPVTNEGVVGRNFAYQNLTTIKTFFDTDKFTNTFIGAGGAGVGVDDFNADNFDHAKYGFVGGSPFWVNQAGSKPISGLPTPPGTPNWGSKWKAAVADAYTHNVSMDAHGAHQSYRANYLDLDPTYKDVYGQPLLRMTFDWQDNDVKMSQFMYDKMHKIAVAMNPKLITGAPKNANSHFDTTVYQTTHMNGGAIMGEDPKTSAINRYLQSWDVHNVFVPGASAFPQGLGYNPTGMVAALTYWSAKAIRETYLKNPGPLVQA
ncbi:GMC family oxidoreductase [Rouxiella badensis]|jgi:gluconate 2-dehydrogenase alpha chain|uniref:GMC family oxidoreductase n=1 Tax=Rouxiella badensis TaxID=1646377 RepID=A0A1X0WD46_9GAMM|nr:GMC family oxidoreductase [Rouxiella badensis]MCC3703839.1 GMC family oxidoreductase [Rouxiella badensis]MCC3719865.1 GMC family oxidoreductase [Rouxiella badensis]MCC3729283.1 GMC family oxidoreductase [Rouxiella badensis]MCC3733495.1 GMC family oxidoreductase [Rouxiella badensis]MCC3742083.1 GMC family oxidoreductase [Rouxiella badensis]